MNCQKAESFIINPAGAVVEKISSPEDIIIYGTLPIQNDIRAKSAADDILRQRRPRLYGNISLDTYSHLNTQMLLGLPENANFTVAALQLRSASFDVEGNLGKMLELIDKAVKKANFSGSALNLVVFPELATTGPLSNLQDALMLSEEVPGRTTEMLANKAREKNIFIVFGMAERKGDRLYNSSVLVGPEGVVGAYRKVHLTSQDKRWACEGNCGFPAFNLPFGRVGMQIGFDLLFPEGPDSLSKVGTDLLCVPAFWEDEKDQVHLGCQACRADALGRCQSVGRKLWVSRPREKPALQLFQVS